VPGLALFCMVERRCLVYDVLLSLMVLVVEGAALVLL
jgi:hypothetical protein